MYPGVFNLDAFLRRVVACWLQLLGAHAGRQAGGMTLVPSPCRTPYGLVVVWWGGGGGGAELMMEGHELRVFHSGGIPLGYCEQRLMSMSRCRLACIGLASPKGRGLCPKVCPYGILAWFSGSQVSRSRDPG